MPQCGSGHPIRGRTPPARPAIKRGHRWGERRERFAPGFIALQRKPADSVGVSIRARRRSYTLDGAENWLPACLRDVAEAKKALIERLFGTHRAALQAFFYRRVRHQPDATDLAQEVYVRMLRIRDPDTIQDIEAYLFTVASNLAREHAAREGRRGITVDAQNEAVIEDLAEPAALDAEIDTAQQVRRLREMLRELPPRWHAAIVMQYVYGLSQREIAERLGVSVSMVKKYLGKALGRCRCRMARLG